MPGHADDSKSCAASTNASAHHHQQQQQHDDTDHHPSTTNRSANFLYPQHTIAERSAPGLSFAKQQRWPSSVTAAATTAAASPFKRCKWSNHSSNNSSSSSSGAVPAASEQQRHVEPEPYSAEWWLLHTAVPPIRPPMRDNSLGRERQDCSRKAGGDVPMAVRPNQDDNGHLSNGNGLSSSSFLDSESSVAGRQSSSSSSNGRDRHSNSKGRDSDTTSCGSDKGTGGGSSSHTWGHTPCQDRNMRARGDMRECTDTAADTSAMECSSSCVIESSNGHQPSRLSTAPSPHSAEWWLEHTRPQLNVSSRCLDTSHSRSMPTKPLYQGFQQEGVQGEMGQHWQQRINGSQQKRALVDHNACVSSTFGNSVMSDIEPGLRAVEPRHPVVTFPKAARFATPERKQQQQQYKQQEGGQQQGQQQEKDQQLRQGAMASLHKQQQQHPEGDTAGNASKHVKPR